MRVLVIEDSARLRRSLYKGLRHEGFTVDTAGDGPKGLSYIRVYKYDVIVLDLILPGMDGLSVLRQLRREGQQVHVLILSAKGELEDRLCGLNLGADDYLTKPFAFEELCSRLRALMRRPYEPKDPVIDLGGVSLDTALRIARVDVQELPLTRTEFSLLELLALSRGSVLSRECLRHQLYTSKPEISSNLIDVVISTLRRKIRAAGGPALIQTVRGKGYLIAQNS